MTQAISAIRSLVPTVLARATTPVPTPTPPQPVRPPQDFERLLRQAILVGSQGGDAREVAVPMFWKALRAGSSLEDSLRLVDAVAPLGLAYKDVKIAAMNQAIVRIGSRAEAMKVAEAFNAKGQGADDWTVGALRKALDASRTAEECQEVATFAKDHGRFMRYRDIRNDAQEKADRLR